MDRPRGHGLTARRAGVPHPARAPTAPHPDPPGPSPAHPFKSRGPSSPRLLRSANRRLPSPATSLAIAAGSGAAALSSWRPPRPAARAWEPAELGTGRTMPPRSTAGDAGFLGTLLGSCRRGWLPTAPAFGMYHPASMPIRSASPSCRTSPPGGAGSACLDELGRGARIRVRTSCPSPPSAGRRRGRSAHHLAVSLWLPPGRALGCPARRRPVRFRPNAIAPAGPLGPAPGRAGAGIDCCYHRRGRHRRVGVLLVQEPAEGRLERRAGDLALPGRPVDRRLDVPAPGRPLLARQRVAPGGPRPCPRHVPLGVVAAEDVRNRSHRRAVWDAQARRYGLDLSIPDPVPPGSRCSIATGGGVIL